MSSEPGTHPASNRTQPVWTNAIAEDARWLIQRALDEDLCDGLDLTSCALIPPDASGAAELVARQSGVFCGEHLCRLIVDEFASDLQLELDSRDGDSVTASKRLGTLRGQSRQILLYERTLLNFLGRLSGVATLASQFVQRVAGTKAQILDTRKTTPGWRLLEKHAVACGGGCNHRLGLYDGILIKDNHLAIWRQSLSDNRGSVDRAVQQARLWLQSSQQIVGEQINVPITVEVDSLEQMQLATEAAPEVILLDNMSIETIRRCVAFRNQHTPQIALEVSGGVNLKTVGEIARTGVDRISIGALTHSAPNFDIALDWM